MIKKEWTDGELLTIFYLVKFSPVKLIESKEKYITFFFNCTENDLDKKVDDFEFILGFEPTLRDSVEEVHDRVRFIYDVFKNLTKTQLNVMVVEIAIEKERLSRELLNEIK